MAKNKCTRLRMSRKRIGRETGRISSFRQNISRLNINVRQLKKAIARLESERGRIAEKVEKYKKDKAILEKRQLVFTESEEGEFVKEVNKHLRDAKHIIKTPYSLEYWERKLKEADAMLIGPKLVLEVNLDKIDGLKSAIKKMQ